MIALRTGRRLSLLKTRITSDETTLVEPSRLSTSFVESTMIHTTDGVGAIESQAYCGDFSQAHFGVSLDFEIFVLKERFLSNSGHVGFIVFSRGNIGFARDAAFAIATKITGWRHPRRTDLLFRSGSRDGSRDRAPETGALSRGEGGSIGDPPSPFRGSQTAPQRICTLLGSSYP